MSYLLPYLQGVHKTKSTLNKRVFERVLRGRESCRTDIITKAGNVLIYPCAMRQLAGNKLGLSRLKDFVF